MSLVFNDTSTKLGLCQEIDDLCDTDSTTYPLASKARRCNIALEDLEVKILMQDGRWQFDDANYASLPTGLSNLVDNQQAYTFDSTLLMLERMEILLIDGATWQPLDPIEETDIPFAIQMYQNVKGIPLKYAKRGNSFLLFPSPDTTKVTATNGCKSYFKRVASLFTAADTTKMPGIASPYHVLIAQKAALAYCQSYKKDRVPALINAITVGEAGMLAFYARRSKDERPHMSTARVSFR